MTVTLLRPYQGFATAAVVTFPDSTESALIAQGYATAASGQPAQTFTTTNDYLQRPTIGGNTQTVIPPSGIANPTISQGPRIIANANTTAFASAGSSTVMVAGSWYRGEIYIPHIAQWTGLAVLNGATVGTDNLMVGLWDSGGNLITNSAVAGALSAGANTFQTFAFLTQPILMPGRYFCGIQCNGTTATTRRQQSADGASCMGSIVAGTFGTVPSTFTVPTTFTSGAAPIVQIYQ